jgi:hypothetical protein
MRMRLLLVVVLMLVCAYPASAQTPSPLPTATPTPTAIPTVVLALSTSGVISSTADVAQQLGDFTSAPDTSAYLLILAVVVIGFWFFMLIKEVLTWRSADE